MNTSEDFIRWMLLEAEASRAGLPVHPDVECAALFIDESMRKLSERFLEFAREHADEIREFSEGR